MNQTLLQTRLDRLAHEIRQLRTRVAELERDARDDEVAGFVAMAMKARLNHSLDQYFEMSEFGRAANVERRA